MVEGLNWWFRKRALNEGGAEGRSEVLDCETEAARHWKPKQLSEEVDLDSL
jgi:hypothetical protein